MIRRGQSLVYPRLPDPSTHTPHIQRKKKDASPLPYANRRRTAYALHPDQIRSETELSLLYTRRMDQPERTGRADAHR